MRLRFWLAFLVTGGVLLVPGCNFPRPPIVCPATDLIAPMLKSPDGRATTTDTTPTLMWRYRTVTYPYPQPDPLPSPEYQCRPNKFRISLSTAPDFTDELGAEVGGGIAGEWTTPILEIGRTYRWSVTAISKGVDGPASETRYLSIGDDCDPTSVQAPILLAPANGSTVDTLTPRVMWDVAGTCLPIGYTVEYSQDAAFNTSMQVGTTGYYAYDWQLPELKDCATYYWRVLAWDGLGAGPYSEVWSFDVQRPGLCLEMAPAPALPGEVPPTLTSDERVWTVIMNANCRTGPGTVYNETSYVPEGYEAPVEGRNEDGSWFRVTDAAGISCWVSGVTLEVAQDWETTKVLAYPAAPSPTKTPAPKKPPAEEAPAEELPPQELPPPAYDCSQYKDPYTCEAATACVWAMESGGCIDQ